MEKEDGEHTPIVPEPMIDPLVDIINDDNILRIQTRGENENKFDNLLSGTTATLVI